MDGFSGGCEHRSGVFHCSKLFEGKNQLSAEGFLIASSSELVALYKDGTVELLELKGVGSSRRYFSRNPNAKHEARGLEQSAVKTSGN